MAGKLIMTVGIPGSGKSTWAESLRQTDPNNFVIVERDATRTVLFGPSYHKGAPNKKAEDEVTQVNSALVKSGLSDGKTVIISDTNVNSRVASELVRLARENKSDFEFEHFDVSPEECKRRNEARGAAGGRQVPDEIMDRFISNAYGIDGKLKKAKVSSKTGIVSFVPEQTPGSKLIDAYNTKAIASQPFTSSAVVIVDCDGTLFNNSHDAARFLHGKGKKNYGAFYRAVEKSPVNENVRDLANMMRDDEDLNIVVLTGRDDSCAAELVSAVERSGIKASRLIAKKEGDFRPDYDFKHEVLEGLKSEGLVPVHAFDDREGSIKTLESHGILVSKVTTPTFPPGSDLRTPAPTPEVSTIYGSGSCIRCGRPLKSGGNIGPRCRTSM